MIRPAILSCALLAAIIAAAIVAHAQSPAQPQAVPAPKAVLGFDVGDDRRLATYEEAVNYLRALERASPKIRLVKIGETSLGRPMMCAVVTSAENMQRLDRLREISARLALAEGLTEQEARALAEEGRAVVYIDGGLHASEVAPAQHNLQLAYDLVASQDADTRFILDNTVLLLNFANPDGMDIVNEWYRQNVGTPFEESAVPRLYHAYAGHDNNRDSFMLNLKETRHIHKLLYSEWYPVIQINHHQPAPFPTRVSIPPLPEPLNPNIHPLLTRWKNLLGAAMGAAYERSNQPGAISRIVIDGWAPEMLDAVGDLYHSMSSSPETAQSRYATPRYYPPEEFPEEYRDFTPGVFYPNPWKGGWWRLKDAVDYILTCSKSALATAAAHRVQLLYDKYRMSVDTIARYQKAAPYAWMVPRQQWDPVVAADLVNRVRLMNIRVYESREAFSSGGQAYPAGTWIIPMQQPFAGYVKTIFEEQRYPDLAQYPSLWQAVVRPRKIPNLYLPPYDTAGWTLPYQMGVTVSAATEPLQVPMAPVERAVPQSGSVEGDATAAYLIPPEANNGFVAVNRILARQGRVSRAKRSFHHGSRSFAAGTWIVHARTVSKDAMQALAKDLSLDITGARTLDAMDAIEIALPRLAVYQSYMAPQDEGWTRWLLEEYAFSFTTIHDGDIRAGGLRARFDAIVIPDMRAPAIFAGHRAGTMPEQYVGGVSARGVASLKTFVEEGGTVIFANGASQFALDYLAVPVRDALAEIRTPQRSDASIPAEVKFASSGSIVKMTFESTHPVGFGMPGTGAAVFADSMAFDVAPGTKGVTVVARYPSSGPLLLSGFLKGDEYLHGKPAIVEVEIGRGKAILLGFGTHRRAQPHGTFKLFFNSIFASTSRTSRIGWN